MTRTADIHRQASDWVIRLNSDQVTRAQREQFKAWIEADPAHATAYAEHAALFAGIGSLRGSDEARFLLMSPSPRRSLLIDRRTLFLGAAGMAASALAFIIAPASGEKIFETKPGEQKRVRLDDGSNILVNTDSRIRVRMTRAERRIFLEDGQAYFDVAKDQSRPFRVFVGQDEVRALGTAFDIHKLGTTARVTLEEGRVAIYRNNNGSTGFHRDPTDVTPDKPAAVLAPGEQAFLAAEKDVVVANVNLQSARAWRYGQIVLDETPLGDMVSELNRYGGPKIILKDSSLAAIKVSGVFHTGDPEGVTETICRTFPIQIVSEDDHSIVLGRKTM